MPVLQQIASICSINVLSYTVRCSTKCISPEAKLEQTIQVTSTEDEDYEDNSSETQVGCL